MQIEIFAKISKTFGTLKEYRESIHIYRDRNITGTSLSNIRSVGEKQAMHCYLPTGDDGGFVGFGKTSDLVSRIRSAFQKTCDDI